MDGWKVVAIIFIVLFILETVGVIWLTSIGRGMIKRDYECQINTCDEYDSYLYDDDRRMCYCYTNGELLKQEYIG